MSSESEHEEANKDSDNISIFVVEQLKKYQILLQKTQLPIIKSQKKEAIKQIIINFKEKFKNDITEKQLNKKIANTKNRLKNKSDVNKTGNKKIVLKDWERDLLNLMNNEGNPTINKIPGYLNVGGERRNEVELNSSSFNKTMKRSSTSPPPCATSKKSRLTSGTKEDRNCGITGKYETVETRNLTTLQLQRLVLLKQNLVLDQKLVILKGQVGSLKEKNNNKMDVLIIDEEEEEVQ